MFMFNINIKVIISSILKIVIANKYWKKIINNNWQLPIFIFIILWLSATNNHVNKKKKFDRLMFCWMETKKIGWYKMF